jgi:hypothetical protein
VWADPDLEQAAALMQSVFSDREQARSRGRLARAEMIARHSPDVAGVAIERRLRSIAERMYADGARALNLARLPAITSEEPGSTGANQHPPIDWGQGAMARVKRRAHRPIDAWAHALSVHDADLRQTISALDARIRDIARTLQDLQNARHAETMAELRRIRADLRDSPGAGHANGAVEEADAAREPPAATGEPGAESQC